MVQSDPQRPLRPTANLIPGGLKGNRAPVVSALGIGQSFSRWEQNLYPNLLPPPPAAPHLCRRTHLLPHNLSAGTKQAKRDGMAYGLRRLSPGHSACGPVWKPMCNETAGLICFREDSGGHVHRLHESPSKTGKDAYSAENGVSDEWLQTFGAELKAAGTSTLIHHRGDPPTGALSCSCETAALSRDHRIRLRGSRITHGQCPRPAAAQFNRSGPCRSRSRRSLNRWPCRWPPRFVTWPQHP